MNDASESTLDPAILAYYNSRPEENRLERGLSQLEAERTRRLILRFVPGPPATILDVGGGAGAYAFWLAGLGYAVHLVDAVPRLIEEARTRNRGAESKIASCEVGDARHLAWPDACSDIVLLLGPLYHLTEMSDRVRALSEAHRVLRPGGLLLAAGISRWASVLDGLVRDLLLDPEFAVALDGDVVDGQHRNPADRPGLFTTAYFHTPAELSAEASAAGFAVEGVFGVEGPARIVADFDQRWVIPEQRELMLQLAEFAESDPSITGISPHLLVVARKQ